METPSNRKTATSMSEIFLDCVADLTECPICRDSMKDPRILHCVHTFCCECLIKYARSLGPGEKLACPVCRADFTVPDRGLGGLPKNFIVEKLCEADNEWRKNGSLNHCPKHRDQYLDGFCRDCETAICEKCRKADHWNHNDSLTIEEFYDDFQRDMNSDLSRLDQICSEVEEQSHSVSVTRDNFVDSIERLKDETTRRGEEIKRLIDKQVDLVNEELESKLCEFLKECDSVTGNLQLQKTQLESFKTYTSEVMQRAKPCDLACNAKDIRTRSTELLGTLVAGLEGMYEVTLQSLDTDLLEDTTYNLLGQIDFRRIDLDPPNRRLDFVKAPARIGTILCGDGEEVVGLTVVRGELFVAIANSSEIKVYDALTFDYRSKFLVESLAHPSDLAATKTDLFVFDNRNLAVHKVELETKFSVSWTIQLKNRFGVGPTCYGLGSPFSYLTTGGSGYMKAVCGSNGSSYPFATSSVAQDFSQVALSFAFYKSVSKGFSLTYKGTVLLISPSNFQREIIEFTGDGRVLREISLCFFVHEPRHITLLENDQFLICYGSSNYIGVTKDQMCLVDNDGRLVKRWSKNYQNNNPEREICNVTHFAVDGNGNSFVCDYVGGNVHLFDSSLNFVKKIVTEADGLGNPARVLLERPRGRMFVSDSANKSIAIFQLF